MQVPFGAIYQEPTDIQVTLLSINNVSMLPPIPGHDEINEPRMETAGQGSLPGNKSNMFGFIDHQSAQRMPSKVEKIKVLLIGATTHIREYIAKESVKFGYTTLVLVSEDTAPFDPSEFQIVQNYKDSGVVVIQGDLNNHESLVEAVKAVDVVISVVEYAQLADQNKIIDAIKEVGNIERFIIISEFINDVELVHALDPAKSNFAKMAQIMRDIDAACSLTLLYHLTFLLAVSCQFWYKLVLLKPPLIKSLSLVMEI